MLITVEKPKMYNMTLYFKIRSYLSLNRTLNINSIVLDSSMDYPSINLLHIRISNVRGSLQSLNRL